MTVKLKLKGLKGEHNGPTSRTGSAIARYSVCLCVTTLHVL